MSAKRILFLPSWYPSERDPVAGNFIQDLAKDIANDNHIIDVWHTDLSYQYIGQSKVDSNSTRSLTEYCHQGWTLPKLGKMTHKYWINKVLRQAKITLASSYDIIHTHSYVAHLLAADFKKVFGGKIVCSFHHSDWLLGKVSKYRIEKLRSIVGDIDLAIFPSKALKNAVEKTIGVIAKSSIIPNYVDMRQIPLKESEPSSKSEKVQCISVGSLTEVKNHEALICEWIGLSPNMNLDIIGDGPLQAQLIELTRTLEIDDQVKILPSMSKCDLLQQYCKYDMYLSMSNVETFGMTMLEAIAAGIPVITTTHTGPSEFIDNSNGVIAKSKDLVSVIEKVAENLTHYAPINLRSSVLDFDKSNVVKKYGILYEELVGKQKEIVQ